MSNVGCEQDVPMAHVRKLQFAVTGYERSWIDDLP
jgi:hypothetical protein